MNEKQFSSVPGCISDAAAGLLHGLHHDTMPSETFPKLEKVIRPSGMGKKDHKL